MIILDLNPLPTDIVTVVSRVDHSHTLDPVVLDSEPTGVPYLPGVDYNVSH